MYLQVNVHVDEKKNHNAKQHVSRYDFQEHAVPKTFQNIYQI